MPFEPKKIEIGPSPSNVPRNGFSPIKISKSLRPAPYKQTTGTLIVITDSKKIGLLLFTTGKNLALNLHFFLYRERAVQGWNGQDTISR